MTEDIAIRVSNITKQFKVHIEQSHSLKDYLVFHNRNRIQLRDVIRGISFEVKRGEAVALIGRNGCGKSTTLKMLTKILRPDSGSIEMNGRVSSLIELGAGFHPDMTGRENVYINASIFGLKKREIDERLDDIIRFSELEEFIDQPVRTYSSGMYMRLAFSVAINVSADILLIDEILAVGDSSFQRKCFNKLTELKENGTTIVIVSHSIDQVKAICDRAIWIYEGLIREEGNPNEVCDHYLDEMEHQRSVRHDKEESERKGKVAESAIADAEEQKKKTLEERFNSFEKCKEINTFCCPEAKRKCTGKIWFTKFEICNNEGSKIDRCKIGDRIQLSFEYESSEENIPISMSFELSTQDGIVVYGSNSSKKDKRCIQANKKGKILYNINSLALLPGKYYLKIRICGENDNCLDNISKLMIVTIEKKEINDEYGFATMNHQWVIE